MKKLFLTGIAALFLTTGTAHAEVLMFMPPAKYDKPFTGGDLTIFRVATQQDIRDICLGFNKQKSLPATACSKTNQTTRCYIFVLTDQALKTIGSNYAIVLRHELAHCNGWPEDHAGGKKVSMATRVEMPKLPAFRYLVLSPPTICITPDWQPESCEDRATKDIWSTARPFQESDVPKKVER